MEADGALPEAWSAYWDLYVESKVDPRAKAPALEAKSAQAGADMLTIWKDAAGCWPIIERDSFVLLQRVFLENYALDAEGRAQKTRAQPTGAVHNPHEPQAQWSSKSTTKDKSWVGYKVQVAETVQEQPREAGEPTANFLTAIVTQNAPASDKAGMGLVAGEQKRMGLDAPSALYVDGAYVSSQALNDAREQGRELRGPAPASPDRGKVVYRIEWSNTVCGPCPLRQQCISASQDHRTFVVGELHSLLQERRREMQTDAFKKEMHRRNGIEGTQSELVRGYGLRQARYRGQANVRLQNYLIGTACNIRRLFRRLVWESNQARCAANVAMAPVTC